MQTAFSVGISEYIIVFAVTGNDITKEIIPGEAKLTIICFGYLQRIILQIPLSAPTPIELLRERRAVLHTDKVVCGYRLLSGKYGIADFAGDIVVEIRCS